MKRLLRRLVLGVILLASLFGALLAYEYSRLPDVAYLKYSNPRTTALIDIRNEEDRKRGTRPQRRQVWISYDAVAEPLKEAILLSEDASFFDHGGVDYYELKEAIRTDLEQASFKRGGSTITMQLARNLYLSPSKNMLRKMREMLIAWKLERTLSKRRIFELYLNLVEWGPGIYGAEAASRYYYAKPAWGLDPVEAATLAALLPNPRNPKEKALLYRRNLILARMAHTKQITPQALENAKKTPLSHRHAPLRN